MAWFDYLSGIGQGLGSGVQQYQRQQQQRLENTRQQQLLSLQEAQNRRAEEEAAAQEFERLLSQIEPGAELTPDVMTELTNPRFAQYAKAAVVKTPSGKLARRANAAQQKAALDLEVATLQRDEAMRQQSARDAIRKAGRGIYSMPLEDRMLLANEAGYAPERLLSQKEQVQLTKQLNQVSPSVLSANIMSNVRMAGAQTSPQEARVMAQRAVNDRIKLNPALQLEVSRNPERLEQLVQEEMMVLLGGGGMSSGRGGATMPAGFSLVP